MQAKHSNAHTILPQIPVESEAPAHGAFPEALLPRPQRNPDSSFNWINPKLAIGNYIAATDVALIRQEGIAAIFGLTATLRGHTPEQLGVKKIVIHEMRDGPGNGKHAFTALVDELYKLVVTTGPVMIHCHAGQSRSVALAAAYLMKTEGYPAEVALRKVEKLRNSRVNKHVRQLLA